MKTLITGGNGMLGRAVRKLLPNAIVYSSKEVDLKDPLAANEMFLRERPDAVIHLAGRIGGVKDNSEFPYDYYLDNVLINTNAVNCCLKHDVRKLVAISSTCVYPKNIANYPISEDMIYEGYPEPSNFAYAHAKRGMQAHIQAAREQYNKNWTVLYSSNLYGPYDHFEAQRSHVISALIYKIHKAKISGEKSVEILGDGSPLRQFTYVDDMAAMIVEAMKSDIIGDFNFCNERNYSIRELADLIKNVIDYNGEIRWSNHLNGIHRKDVTCDKIRCAFSKDSFNITPLEAGLAKTYEWYLSTLLVKDR